MLCPRVGKYLPACTATLSQKGNRFSASGAKHVLLEVSAALSLCSLTPRGTKPKPAGARGAENLKEGRVAGFPATPKGERQDMLQMFELDSGERAFAWLVCSSELWEP